MKIHIHIALVSQGIILGDIITVMKKNIMILGIMGAQFLRLIQEEEREEIAQQKLIEII